MHAGQGGLIKVCLNIRKQVTVGGGGCSKAKRNKCLCMEDKYR